MIFKTKNKTKTIKDFNIENAVVTPHKDSYFLKDTIAMGCSDGGCWSTCFVGPTR